MAEVDRTDAEGETSRDRQSRLGVYLRRGGVQPREDEKAPGQPGWCRMSHRGSVPAPCDGGQNEPQITSTYTFKSAFRSGLSCIRHNAGYGDF